jgi:hypothetical protein
MDCILIQAGRAHEIWPNTTKSALCYKVHDGEIEARPIFPPDTIAAIVEVAGGSVQVGATWDGSTFTNPPAPPQPTLAEYTAAKRYAVEIAGVDVTIGGVTVPVSTRRGNDREVMTATFVAIAGGLRTDGATFVFDDGIPRSVSNAEMQGAILAALAHVQVAFDKQREVMAAIGAGTITNTAGVDAAFASL